ncbi:hypothetical protein BGW41_005985 [Actinomortierella wolfii]|nr:hypothetical protein BGW41_005985 [Actinomortierella wolfii]
MQQHGQTLIINSPTPGDNSPKGSLSNRFAKIAQSRQKAGVVVVGTGGIETRPGKTLGLGFNTGIHPSQLGASGQRISTTKGGKGRQHLQQTTGLAGVPTASIGKGGKILGIQTPAALARAMQEKGGGASEELLTTMNQPIIHEARAPGRRKRPQLRGVGAAEISTTPAIATHPRQRPATHPSRQARASPYAAAAASRRGASKAAAAAPSRSQGYQGAQSGPAVPAGAGKDKGKIKGKKAGVKGKSKTKPAKATASSLDSDLTAYMMKNDSTASAILDNDLDTYMAEKPDDMTF